MFKFSTLATLFCTAALVSQSVVAARLPYRYRRSVPVYKRALEVGTYDGSPVDPVIVDFVDQFEYMKNAAASARAGTSQYTSILSEYAAVSSTLSAYMEGYATFVTPTPTSTNGPEASSVPTQAPTSEPPVESGEPTPTPAPSPTTAPTPTSSGPVIVTVVPQPNTSVVVIASDGTTRTVTRTGTTSSAKATVTVTVASESGGASRSATATSKGAPGQTAIAASAETGPKNDARGAAAGHQGLWLIPLGMLVMTVL